MKEEKVNKMDEGQMEVKLTDDIKKFQNSPSMCDYREDCIQHPLVCINCIRRYLLKDCFKLPQHGLKEK